MFLTAWIESTGFDQTIDFLLQVDVGEVAVEITEIVKAEVDIFDIPSASQDVLTIRIKSTWYDQTTIFFQLQFVGGEIRAEISETVENEVGFFNIPPR